MSNGANPLIKLASLLFPVRFLKPRPTFGQQPLNFQLLFSDCADLERSIDERTLLPALKAHHRILENVRMRCETSDSGSDCVQGLIGWKSHIVEFRAFKQPVPEAILKPCVESAHYSDELKQSAMSHQCHLVLSYRGYSPKVLEHYIALALIAGVFAKLGAMVVVNETAGTSVPAQALSGEDIEADLLQVLEQLPLPLLYCGFDQQPAADGNGIWMRTRGAWRMGLVDLAVRANNLEEGERWFAVFDTLIAYQVKYPNEVKAGNSLQISDHENFTFTNPPAEADFLDNNGALLVGEVSGV